jgi:MEMO1 family protein
MLVSSHLESAFATSRRAGATTCAGSWYTDSKKALTELVDGHLRAAKPPPSGTVKAVIGPHAGYTYCGAVLGQAYRCLPEGCTRVILLGPSHHVYLDKSALSTATHLRTPLGDLAVDTRGNEALMKTGLFQWFDLSDDEEEHSIEMHLPFLQRAVGKSAPTVLPIVVGDLSARDHKRLAEAISPLVAEPGTVLAVSTDFCHWGRRFRFTSYDTSASTIYKGIESLDLQGMDVSHPAVRLVRSPSHVSGAMQAMKACNPDSFREYIRATRNTICGRHALCVLLELGASGALGKGCKIEWMAYAQSGRVMTMSDSSVSYGAGVLVSDDAESSSSTSSS